MTDLKVYADIRSRIKAVPSQINLVNVGEMEASAEFLVLTKESNPILIDQYQIDADYPLQVEPLEASGGVAKFRISSPPPIDLEELTRKVTIRIPLITDESAVFFVNARSAQP